MIVKIKKFKSESKWKDAIFAKLDSVDSKSFVVPGGKTPLFLYKEYFSKKEFVTLIPSDDRVTENIVESNYKLIKSFSKSKVIELCDFPISNYFDIDPNKVSEIILSCPFPDIAVLGLGEDGHYASIFPCSNTIKQDKKNVIKIIHTDCSDQKYRVTLTENFIQSIRELLFVVKGPKKFKIVKEIEENFSSIGDLPIGKLIKSYNGNLSI